MARLYSGALCVHSHHTGRVRWSYVVGISEETTSIRTVHTKQTTAQARKGTLARGTQAESQATTPNRAKRGAIAGTASTRARVTTLMTAPGRCARTAAGRPASGAGRTCSRGASGADPRLRGAARERRRK